MLDRTSTGSGTPGSGTCGLTSAAPNNIRHKDTRAQHCQEKKTANQPVAVTGVDPGDRSPPNMEQREALIYQCSGNIDILVPPTQKKLMLCANLCTISFSSKSENVGNTKLRPIPSKWEEWIPELKNKNNYILRHSDLDAKLCNRSMLLTAVNWLFLRNDST